MIPALIVSIIGLNVNGQFWRTIASKAYSTIGGFFAGSSSSCEVCNSLAKITNIDEDRDKPIETLVEFHCVIALVILA